MMDGAAYVDQAMAGYQAAQKPKAGVNGKVTPEKAKSVAQDFEAFFLSRMLDSMFSGLRTDGMFGGGHGEEVFRSVMIQEYGKEMAQRGGFGIADAVQKHLLSMQEAGK